MPPLPPLTLSFDDQSTSPDRVEVIFGFGAGTRERVYFHAPGQTLRPSGDVLFCLGLVAAMEIGTDLVIDRPVDDTLLANCDKIQSLLCQWYPGHRPIAVHAKPARSDYPRGRGTGAFYSGGVDSSFTVADAMDRLDAIVTVIGGDRRDDSRLAGELGHMVRRVATAYDLEPILVETNIRNVYRKLVGWVEYHGSFLAAVRHLLADRLEHQLIASSADESSWTRRWGSHPALDSLLGTPGAGIEHHGLVHRFAKIERIIQEPALMAHLRVCTRSDKNCGRCKKCTFVLQALDTLQAMDRAPTFSQADLGHGPIAVTGEGSRSDLINLRQAAVTRGHPTTLPRQIDRAMVRYDTKKRLQRILPTNEMVRRGKRVWRRRRFRAAAKTGARPHSRFALAGSDQNQPVSHIFIVGTGRSGTHLLAQTLIGHADIFDLFSGRENKLIFRCCTLAALNNAHRLPLRARIFYAVAGRLARERIFLDQTHPNLFFADHILQLFPDCRLIATWRETNAVVASMLNHANVMRWYDKAARLPMPNQFLGDVDRCRFDQMSLVEKCALRVVRHKNEISRIKSAYPRRVRIQRFEPLVTKQFAEANEIYSWLGLPQQDIPFSTSDRSSLDKWRSTLTDDDLHQIEAIERTHRNYLEGGL